MSITVGIIRELFRHLQAWESLLESDGLDELHNNGETWHIADVQYLYRKAQELLPPQQRRAIQLCLYENVKESEAAKRMGVSETNPVAAYATSGLENLIVMIREGRLPGFREESLEEAS